MKVAAIGIGSNSLRMLIADIEGTQLVHSVRYRKGLRVFAALDENRCITSEMIEQACDSVLEFKQEAENQKTQAIHLFATSATRDASNQQVFLDALLEKTGLKVDICSGDMEAALSFWGACGLEKCGLIDIGGGSTELALGCGKTISDAVSLQMGAVRLFRALPITSSEEADKVVKAAAQIIAPVRERFAVRNDFYDWVGVGGTFTTTAALVQRIPWQQREKIHHFTMTINDVKDAMNFLAPMPLEERLKLPCLQPQRADIVVHGIAILLACMQELNIPQITVSEHGNLEGYLKLKYIFEK